MQVTWKSRNQVKGCSDSDRKSKIVAVFASLKFMRVAFRRLISSSLDPSVVVCDLRTSQSAICEIRRF